MPASAACPSVAAQSVGRRPLSRSVPPLRASGAAPASFFHEGLLVASRRPSFRIAKAFVSNRLFSPVLPRLPTARSERALPAPSAYRSAVSRCAPRAFPIAGPCRAGRRADGEKERSVYAKCSLPIGGCCASEMISPPFLSFCDKNSPHFLCICKLLIMRI